MMNYQTGETTRLKRQRIEQAIHLALQSRWKEAAALNRSIVSLFPSDVDAYNRLGKALMEMGEFAKARASYLKALALEPGNSIARKNLDRLAVRAKAAAATQVEEGTKTIDPSLFIAETGKTGVATLRSVNGVMFAKLTAGETVDLHPQDNTLAVTTLEGEFIGLIEPKMGLRLRRLMEGGNRYVAAVASVSEQRVIIREIHQHPSQQGRPSFPATGPEPVRAYVKGRLIRHDLDDEESTEENEEGEEWGTETVHSDGDISLQEYQESTESVADVDEEIEE